MHLVKGAEFRLSIVELIDGMIYNTVSSDCKTASVQSVVQYNRKPKFMPE